MPETNDVISHLYYDLNDKISDIDSRVGDTESRLDDIDIVDATEPKVYVALLSQTGVLAPVATVLKNTLGGTVVWTYNDVGKYIGTLASTFTEDKTFCLSQVANTETPDIVNSFGRATTNTVSLQVFVPGFGFSDVFTDLQVRIEVYP